MLGTVLGFDRRPSGSRVALPPERCLVCAGVCVVCVCTYVCVHKFDIHRKGDHRDSRLGTRRSELRSKRSAILPLFVLLRFSRASFQPCNIDRRSFSCGKLGPDDNTSSRRRNIRVHRVELLDQLGSRARYLRRGTIGVMGWLIHRSSRRTSREQNM